MVMLGHDKVVAHGPLMDLLNQNKDVIKEVLHMLVNLVLALEQPYSSGKVAQE